MNLKRIEDIGEEELGVSLVDWVCFKYSACSLEEIRQWLGKESFIELLNIFSGSYVTIPTSRKLFIMSCNFRAALALKRLRNARAKKDLNEVVKQEVIIQEIAKKSKKKLYWVQETARRVLKELETAKEWMSKMKIWRKKFLGE